MDYKSAEGLESVRRRIMAPTGSRIRSATDVVVRN